MQIGISFVVFKAIIFCFVEGIFLNDEKDLIPINIVSPQFKRILPMPIEKVNGLIKIGVDSFVKSDVF